MRLEETLPVWAIYVDEEDKPVATLLATGVISGLRETVTRELDRALGRPWTTCRMVHSKMGTVYSFPREGGWTTPSTNASTGGSEGPPPAVVESWRD